MSLTSSFSNSIRHSVRNFKMWITLFGIVTFSNVSLIYQKRNDMTTQQNIDSLTKAMIRREQEISRMTKYINQVGEEAAGSEYMEAYEQELRMWDEMKAKRDSLKIAA